MSAITQYFFNADAYFRFVEDSVSAGRRHPHRAGHHAHHQLQPAAALSDACGAEIPRWIRLRLQAFGDDTASIRAFGLDVVSQLCEQLLRAGRPRLALLHDDQVVPTLALCQLLGAGWAEIGALRLAPCAP